MLAESRALLWKEKRGKRVPTGKESGRWQDAKDVAASLCCFWRWRHLCLAVFPLTLSADPRWETKERRAFVQEGGLWGREDEKTRKISGKDSRWLYNTEEKEREVGRGREGATILFYSLPPPGERYHSCYMLSGCLHGVFVFLLSFLLRPADQVLLDLSKTGLGKSGLGLAVRPLIGRMAQPLLGPVPILLSTTQAAVGCRLHRVPFIRCNLGAKKRQALATLGVPMNGLALLHPKGR